MDEFDTDYLIVYRWVHRFNNLFYIGIHQIKYLIGENDGYLGSGKRFLEAYKKEPGSWKRDILFRVKTLKEAHTIEKTLVNLTMVKNPLCLNDNIGGKGSWTKYNKLPNDVKFPPERREKLSEFFKEMCKKRNNYTGGSNPAAKKIKLTNRETGKFLIVNTMNETAAFIGCSRDTLRSIMNGKNVNQISGKSKIDKINSKWIIEFDKKN